VVPSRLVISLSVVVPVPLATAANKPKSGDQVIPLHELVTGTDRETHVSLPVIVKLCFGFFMNDVVIHLVPAPAVAANIPSDGDHAIDANVSESATIELLAVQVMPSRLVIIRFVLLYATATNKLNSAAQTIADHQFASDPPLASQFIPS